MAITDYLSGINRATTGEKADVSSAAKDLANLQAGAGSLPTKLKEALNTKLNNNRDIINQQADTMGAYFNAAPAARVKYADVFDPFKKAELVQQDRTAALRPYDVLSGVLENRMGSVNDIVQSGIQGWQGLVNAAGTKAELAKSNLANALQAYITASGQQSGADQMEMEAAKAREASRQFGISSGMEQQRIDNQKSQFAESLALDKLRASLSGSGTSDKNAQNTLSAWNNALASGTNPDGSVNEWKVWNFINQNKDMVAKSGVNVGDLWNAHTALKTSLAQPVVPVAPKKNTIGDFFSGLGSYFKPGTLSESSRTPIPVNPVNYNGADLNSLNDTFKKSRQITSDFWNK